jgi:predicted nucleic acid-binding protein
MYPKGKPSLALYQVANYHELVLTDYNIQELRRIVTAKFSRLEQDLDLFLAELSYELIIAPYSPQKLIRDPKDQPILDAAVVADVDVILTGDKDFLALGLERPRSMTVARFLEEEFPDAE